MEIATLLRLANLILAMIGLAALGVTMMTRRQQVSRRIRRVTMWVYGMLMYTAYASGVALSRGTQISLATWMIALVLTGLVVSLVWTPEGDDEFPPDDGSLGQRLLDALDHLYHHRRF